MLMNPLDFKRLRKLDRCKTESELLERVAIRTISGRGVASIWEEASTRKGRGLGGVVVGREGGVKDKEGEHRKRGPSQKEGRNSTVEGQGKKKAGRKGVEILVSGRSWSRLNGNLRPFVLWELEPPPAWIHLVLKKRAKGRGRR